MAKWSGKVGYISTIEDPIDSGIWKEQVTEKSYYGDILRNNNRVQNIEDGLNNDISINNEISIISDPYAIQNFHAIRYAEFMGTMWKVTSVEVRYPRLILNLGGVYNGNKTGTSS